MGIIRLLLAFAVFNSHFPVVDFMIVDGHEAVMGFFAISGFYMALILDTKYHNRSEFYLSRFLTLYPLYVFALIVSVALLAGADIHPLTNHDKMQKLLTNPAGFLIMAWTSVCLIGQEWLFSIGQAVDGTLHLVGASRSSIYNNAPLIQAWSLSLESMFYALAPLLVKLRTRTLLGIVCASLMLRIGIMLSPVSEVSFFWRFFPAEFWLFGSGILAYRFYRTLPDERRPEDVFAFILLFGLICTANDADKWAEPFLVPFGVLAAMPFIFRGTRRLPFDRMTGKLSYPFYLLHFSVIAIFEEYQEEPVGWQIALVALAVAILAHALFNPGIEAMKTKLRAHRARTAGPGSATAPVAAPINPGRIDN